MQLPSFLTKRNMMFIGAAVVIVAILVLFVMPLAGSFKPKTINSYFTESAIKAGGTTTLKVEVTNTLSSDVDMVTITADSISEGITIQEPTKTDTALGKGDRRTFTFPVTASPALLEGTYTIRVTVQLGQETAMEQRIALTITK